MSTATAVLKDLGKSEELALHEYALLNASQKLAELKQECLAFERKYKIKYSDFEKKIKSGKKEIFEQEEDYLAWKFAVEGVGYWQEKIDLLRQEQ